MKTNKNSDKSKQTFPILTDSNLKKIGQSFDRAREKSMKDKRKASGTDFVEVK